MRFGQVELLPPEGHRGRGQLQVCLVLVLGGRGVLRLLNTKPRIEDRRLRGADGPMKCLALNAITAC